MEPKLKPRKMAPTETVLVCIKVIDHQESKNEVRIFIRSLYMPQWGMAHGTKPVGNQILSPAEYAVLDAKNISI